MKHWCWSLLLLCFTAWGSTVIRVGGYPYAPFLFKDGSHYTGLTLELIDLLNGVQNDVEFIFVPSLAPHRRDAMAADRFSLIFFEDFRWGWDAVEVRFTKPLLLGGEKYVALKKDAQDQSYFDHLQKRRLIGANGYSYGIANFNSSPEELKRRFNITLVNDNISALNALFKRRGDVAIVNFAYLNYYQAIRPELASFLRYSDKWDQHYALRAMLSPTAKLSIKQLEAWLAQLEQNGELTQLWIKYGVIDQVAQRTDYDPLIHLIGTP